MEIGTKLNSFHGNLLIGEVCNVYPLAFGGTVTLARCVFGPGQHVGTAPLAVKIDIPDNMGGNHYPKGWYTLTIGTAQADAALKKGQFPEGMLEEVYKQAWQYEIFEPGSTT